ncbi:MAG TPA: glycoside hydrolase family 15 protein, partial [bacterium]|nr:glycoside hydrolase family 15 protein [bacterium]
MKNKKQKILINTQILIAQHLRILKNLEYDSGLFAASNMCVTTGYEKAWIRDNFYECLAFEQLGDWDTVRRTYRALLNIFLKHEYKIDHAIARKPMYGYEYIHPRYNPTTFDEYWEEWGNKQNDAVGAILFKLGELEGQESLSVLKNADDYRLVQKLVKYLDSIRYWEDPDNGIWENEEEIHASSIGACLAGLRKIRQNTAIYVPDHMIVEGEKALHALLPRESKKRFVDLALLSLIYPYDIVNDREKREILKNVEYHLVKKRGLIRYRDDFYYNKNEDKHSEEAEWTFGFSWLAIIYLKLGQPKKAEYYLQRALKTVDMQGYIPELYYSNTDRHNENSPLGWAESLFVCALYLLNEKHHPRFARPLDTVSPLELNHQQ